MMVYLAFQDWILYITVAIQPQFLRLSSSKLKVGVALINYMALHVFFLVVTAAVATTVSATDHIVGANKGWNAGINYTLWSNNQTFYVGDFICTTFCSYYLSFKIFAEIVNSLLIRLLVQITLYLCLSVSPLITITVCFLLKKT